MRTRFITTPFLLLLLLVLLASGCKKEDDIVQDADGNTYHTISIGTQIWMVENLKTTRYNDGTPISSIIDQREWAFQERPGYCDYNNDESNVAKYGRLYNWYAIESGKLAPKGWHVPSKDEWEILISYLIDNGYNYDGTNTDNKIAKSLGETKNWSASTGYNGTLGSSDYPSMNNKSGFNAVPSGGRGWNFEGLGYVGHLWSSTVCDTTIGTDKAYFLVLDNINPAVIVQSAFKNPGLAVRCLKDSY